PDGIEKATAELVAPVVGSTLTTVVVFAPLGLLSGVVGQFFKALSLTLAVSVLISLGLALTLIPMLAHWAYQGEKDSHHSSHGKGLEGRYRKWLARTMDRPKVALIAVAGLAVLAVLLYSQVPSGFLPKMDEGGFVVDYR